MMFLGQTYAKIYVKRIKSLCRQRNLSINKLAEMSGVPQTTLDSLINGGVQGPNTQTIHKIANALNMTLAEFVDFPELNNFSFDKDEEE